MLKGQPVLQRMGGPRLHPFDRGLPRTPKPRRGLSQVRRKRPQRLAPVSGIDTADGGESGPARRHWQPGGQPARPTALPPLIPNPSPIPLILRASLRSGARPEGVVGGLRGPRRRRADGPAEEGRPEGAGLPAEGLCLPPPPDDFPQRGRTVAALGRREVRRQHGARGQRLRAGAEVRRGADGLLDHGGPPRAAADLGAAHLERGAARHKAQVAARAAADRDGAPVLQPRRASQVGDAGWLQGVLLLGYPLPTL